MSLDEGSDRGIQKAFKDRTNPFDELSTRELRTQWKHKVSVVPESEGITTRWWDVTSGVTRDGPEMKVPPGETAGTTQSGEYNVGDPALAGGALRVEGTAQDGDDVWAGYTNRNDVVSGNEDGAGAGYSYFAEGEGDEGGARTAGDQEYVWFRSSVSGVANKRVPRDQWNGDPLGKYNIEYGELFKRGGFIREPFTYYNHGAVNVNYGIKLPSGDIEVVTLHTFTVENSPMWGQSDLRWQVGNVGTNLTEYINAAHFKAGETDTIIRQNGVGRDGTVAGSGVTVSSGDVRPLISIKVRNGWENINVQPISLDVNMDGSFYVFVSLGSDLVGATFAEPGSDIAGISHNGSEYAVLADNDASDFNDVGEVEYFEVADGGKKSANLGDQIENLGLAPGSIATLGIIPIDATAFNNASVRWGMNF